MPRTRNTPAGEPAPPEAADAERAEATCSHYLKQDDETFVTYGAGSVLTADQFTPEAWAGYLVDGRLVLTDRPAIRLDPADGCYMAPVSPIHKED